MFLWSTVATAFKLSLEGMNFAQLLFYSSLASSIALFFIALKSNRKELFQLFGGYQLGKNILLGLLNPFLYYLVLFKAYSLLPAQEAQPLNFTWPIVISLFSGIFLKNKLSASTIMGLLVSFFGVIIIATRGEISELKITDPFGGLLAVGSSLIWASFWTFKLLDKRNEAVKLFGAFLMGTIITAFYILFFDSFNVADPIYLLGAAYVGLFEMGITFYLWMMGLHLSENKAKTSTLAYLTPFISFVFIALILGEKLLLSSIVGLIFIVGGILVQNVWKRRTVQSTNV